MAFRRDNDETISVYVIAGPGAVYVGSTNNPARRWYLHKSAARCGHPHPLYNAMREHGVDAFRLDVVAQAKGKSSSFAVERAVAAQCKRAGLALYNVPSAGGIC